MRRPIERHDALLQKKISERWDRYMELRSSIAELFHAYAHIVDGDWAYIEAAREHRRKVRERARASEPLMGHDFKQAVIAYTDEIEQVIETAEASKPIGDELRQRVEDLLDEVNEVGASALKSVPPA